MRFHLWLQGSMPWPRTGLRAHRRFPSKACLMRSPATIEVLQALTEPLRLLSHLSMPSEKDTSSSVSSPCPPVSGESGVQAHSL